VPDQSEFTAENIVISVLGGIAAALIFAVVTRGGAGGLMLAHLAPLPIMIIALGYGVRHGASAALLATAILSVYPHPVVGMVYAVMVAGPAWLACYAASGAPRGRRDFITSNFPGWAALAPAVVIALSVSLWLIVATLSFGSLDDALNPIRARAFIVLDEMIKENKSLEGKLDPVALSGSVAMAVPAFIASYTVMLHIVNLWIAGRLTLASGLLTRPWPDIAEGYRRRGFPVGARALPVSRTIGGGRLCSGRINGPYYFFSGPCRRPCAPARSPQWHDYAGDYVFCGRSSRLAACFVCAHWPDGSNCRLPEPQNPYSGSRAKFGV
jgi:hypothetical protein